MRASARGLIQNTLQKNLRRVGPLFLGVEQVENQTIQYVRTIQLISVGGISHYTPSQDDQEERKGGEGGGQGRGGKGRGGQG